MFDSDRPVQSIQEDLLKRGAFSSQLANAILSIKTEDTYTIGLFGKWGSGKTSLVNMAIECINQAQVGISDDEKMVVLRFDPWIFTDVKQLIPQFFTHLTSAFKNRKDKRSVAVGKALEDYSGAFEVLEAIPVAGKILSVAGKTAANGIGKRLSGKQGGNDLMQQKAYVENALQKYNKRILIVIDDIDRLSNEQIRGIFQLVTAVAKLPNITYLLVFDKKIVANALQEIQQCDGEDFLEKVIQAPITLPEIRNDDLLTIIDSECMKLMQTYPNTGFDKNTWPEQYNKCVAPFIKTIRDIRRLVNALEFKLSSIGTEVDFADMASITALELFQPSVYQWVVDNIDTLVGTDSFIWGFTQKTHDEWYQLFEGRIAPLIKGDYSKDSMLELLSFIFPKFSDRIGKTIIYVNQDKLRANNRICHPEKCERYFQLNPEFIGVKKAVLLQILQTYNEETIKNVMIEHDQVDKCSELLDNIRSVVRTVPVDRTKVLIDALLSAAPFLASTNTGFLTVSPQISAENLAFDLLANIPSQERLNYISELIENCDIYSLSSFAYVLNIIELSHGRLAANGTPHDYDIIISLDELEQVENKFSQRTKTLLQADSLFITSNWWMHLRLMENYDPEFIQRYMGQLLAEDINVLTLLSFSVEEWTGSGIIYHFNENYKKYVSSDRVHEAINNCVIRNEIKLLPKTNQLKTAAFYINSILEKNQYPVTQKDAESQLQSWANRHGS